MDDKSKKQEIFEQTILGNIKRKSEFVDHVQFVDDTPLFSWIDINPTELCNRKCSFCPRVDSSEYPNQHLNMSVKLANKVASELIELEYEGAVVFSGYSEPLLNPFIVDIVKEFGLIHTEIVTNGDKLDESMIYDLYNAGLDVIVVSLYDGPFQIDEFKEKFEKIGSSESQYILRDRWYDVEEDYGLKLTNRGGKVADGDQPKVQLDRPCYYTHYSLMVDWNGDVMLCVQDWNKKVKFGNVNLDPLFDIWKSHNINKYRKMLGNGVRGISPCNQCNVDGTLHGYNHVKFW